VVIETVGKRKIVPIEARPLRALVSTGGPLSRTLPYFEEREEQMEMITHICDTFNNDALALIEAGTGVGKTLAYLIPAVKWTITNNEKVVISTNTINLQEQLLYKDIPDLEKIMGVEFSYILLKGRGNYICFNRLYEAQQELFSLIDEEEFEQFNAIVEWLRTTEEESLSHLPFIPKSSLWDKINSQTGTCVGGTCDYFSRCPVNRVRRDAAKAHIIVTNHHYLFADAQLGESNASLLPPYRRVIFDEAHNLEDSATSFFTRTVKLSTTLRLLGRIYGKTGKNKGYLVYLQKKKVFAGSRELQEIMERIIPLRSSTIDLFNKFEEFFSQIQGENWGGAILGAQTGLPTVAPSGLLPAGLPSGTSGASGAPGASVVEIHGDVQNHPFWRNTILPSLDHFYRGCSQLAQDLFGIRETLASVHDERAQRQVDGFISGLIDISSTIDRFLGEDDENWVRWIENRREIGIVVSMVEVGDVLNELVFSKMHSCILTSATLTVGGNFEFLKSRLSLGRTDMEVSLSSPFDYEHQMKVIIPNDVPAPGKPRYTEFLGGCILSLLKKTSGKAFVLFTSYKTLNSVHDSIKDELLQSGFVIFKQGEDSRRNLLDNFKSDIHSVLFGTESFWEGVDAPGETLQCVIITKLPFKVPSEPIIRARFEKIRQQGGNPFLDYYTPLAVIKLRQGIGRLIRNRSDRGIIAIFDTRILVKSYGSLFLSSMPTTNVYRGPLQDTLNEVEGFLSITP
jgi:ATP-dependent DNA helicase DinG